MPTYLFSQVRFGKILFLKSLKIVLAKKKKKKLTSYLITNKEISLVQTMGIIEWWVVVIKDVKGLNINKE